MLPPPLGKLVLSGDKHNGVTLSKNWSGLSPSTLATGPSVLHNFSCMTVALVRYDAARKALAAAHRVDEVKAIRDKAEAVRVYAKQARDLEMQNMAAEIRLRAEHRAGELLVDMQATGERQRKAWGRPKKVSSPTTLPRLGITRDQSSKWQRLAQTIDDAAFERAMTQARERNAELTTAAFLREVKEIVKPSGIVADPDINVTAAELVRDLASASRKEKLEEVARLRDRLNPSIRKSLVSALKDAATYMEVFEDQLSSDSDEFPSNGKCHQRVIRERMAKQPDPLLAEKKALAADFEHAAVREVSYDTARNLIVANEWLGNMGTTEFSFGLYFGEYLGGMACFGRTAGTQVAGSICGAEHAHRVATLCRGACVHWAHPHSASFLINAACREMTRKGYHILVAYSDPAAGEIGTVYQASNWLYCGTTNPTEKFRTPSGEIKDARLVSAYSRDRSGGTLKYRCTRAEQKQMLMDAGCEFFREEVGKHRYVGIYGDRRTKRLLRSALRWEVLPYPKRAASPESHIQVIDLDPVPKTFTAASVS